MPGDIRFVYGDAADVTADVLVLKYAEGQQGLAAQVASALGVGDFSVPPGSHRFLSGTKKIGASEVLVMGVGRLRDFEYPQIETFAYMALETIHRKRPNASRIVFTLHGGGYGLDELAAFDSLVAGFEAAFRNWPNLNVIVAETNPRRARKIKSYLGAIQGVPVSSLGDQGAEGTDPAERSDFSPEIATQISRGGTFSKRLFVAMPFSDRFEDHWDLAIQDAVHSNNYVCERLDKESYAGDILAEIKNRIAKSSGVVAVLDDCNANVFLEVGYAWGVGRPTILLLEEGAEAPFDVRGQRLLRYTRVAHLRAVLAQEIAALAANNVI